MEKVKIFTRGTNDTFDILESEVNKWLLVENNGIEIVSRHMMGAAGTNNAGEGFLNCTIVIFYRPK